MPPQPPFLTCGSSPWETEKAVTQGRLLSGRYRVDSLSGHWVPWNREGMCTLPQCWLTTNAHKGTIESFLLSCPSLSGSRALLSKSKADFLVANSDLLPLVTECVSSNPVQFWLDCSTMHQVIRAVQLSGQGLLHPLFKLTQNYCHTLHKGRVKLLEIEQWIL